MPSIDKKETSILLNKYISRSSTYANSFVLGGAVVVIAAERKGNVITDILLQFRVTRQNTYTMKVKYKNMKY